MKDKVSLILTVLIFFLVGVGVFSNIRDQKAIDRSKIPTKVEESRDFQRWITNIKNKNVDIGADDFSLREETEIYNTRWMSIESIDGEGKREEFEKTLESVRDTDMVYFSPSDKEFIDIRPILRGETKPNEVRFYGMKEDKIIDARLLDCSERANCYFDRAFFLDNDVFVITELSRNIDKKDDTTAICLTSELCEYTFKVHVIDLIQNQRLEYISTPFSVVRDLLIPEL